MSNPRSNARDLALEALDRVAQRGAFASSALRSLFAQVELSSRERALATELVYGVLRMRGHLDRAIKAAAGKRLKDLDPALHEPLRLGAYQIIYLDRVPAFAAVDAAVEQVKRKRPARAGQANAILRKLAAADGEARVPRPVGRESDPIRHVAEVGSVSHAIAEVLVRDLGVDQAVSFVEASLAQAPLTLRVNLLRATAEEVAAEIGGTIGALPYAVRIEGGGALPSDLACVIEGRATPQDEAAMRVVELLDPQPGDRVLDVCSAPGGKTTHAAERMRDQGVVIAHDRLPERLERVAGNAARLGLKSIRIADVLPPETESFDRVLVDAPCTGLGTMRRHPEIRWRFKPSDLEELALIQEKVLAAGAARVRPGGVLVYSVCTVTRAEGEQRIATLEDAFTAEEVVRTGPQDAGAPDGFFVARLVRKRSG
jgi:16S rRNA (cytosine967-C5)-methyltransferase